METPPRAWRSVAPTSRSWDLTAILIKVIADTEKPSDREIRPVLRTREDPPPERGRALDRCTIDSVVYEASLRRSGYEVHCFDSSTVPGRFLEFLISHTCYVCLINLSSSLKIQRAFCIRPMSFQQVRMN
ncbi:hypothetical protein GWI33_006678 [Rhynchophorus ferrugineus]|uniref:Uncharacterized protein n=1 Tax=Rhynchophorus ferrugineus TaxID=354439 RepID=A0A834IK03_RHYFE|nr:hypothetical protein GWI33_006678 [Rhynchophorus ferrugineus]